MYFFNMFVIFVCALICMCRSEEECANFDEDGTCLEHCSENTFLYLPGCENETMSQRTCRTPESRSLGYLCDYTRCECHDPSKLWDEAAKKCVLAQECSDQSKVIEEEDKLKELENKTFTPYLEE